MQRIEGIDEVLWQLANDRFAKLHGVLETLALAIRQNRQDLAMPLLPSLIESREAFFRFVDRELVDLRATFDRPEVFHTALQTAVASGMAHAQALALLDFPEEAAEALGSFRERTERSSQRYGELKTNARDYLWLATASDSKKAEYRRVRQEVEAWPSGMESMQRTLELCAETRTSYRALTQRAENEGLLVICP